jgi:cell division protein FtsL
MAKNTNLAYAIRNFEQNETQRQPHIQKLEKTASVRKPKWLGRSAVCLIYVIALCAALIYGRVSLSEVNAQLQEKQAEYKVLDSEYTRLSTAVNSVVSLSNIEEKALELGMTELKPSQIEYIRLEREDKVELSAEKETILSKLSGLFDKIKEYIFG